MRPYQANLILSLSYVVIGLWSYEASGRDLHTLSVPVIGIILSLFHKPMKLEKLKMIKAAMAVTMIVFVIMLLPFRNSIIAQHSMAILRVGILLVMTGIALIYYYRFLRSVQED